MNPTQILTPNPNVTCKPGWCLLYVQDAFNIRPDVIHMDRFAIDAWNTSPFQHPNQEPPRGVWTPGYATISDDSRGHIFLFAPDGSVYSSSSPTGNKPVHHSSLGALTSYYGKDARGKQRISYLGWTDDVEDTLVINQGGKMLTAEYINSLFRAYWGRDAQPQEIAQYKGGDFGSLIDTLDHGPAREATSQAVAVGLIAVRDNWGTQIADLQSALSDATKGAKKLDPGFYQVS